MFETDVLIIGAGAQGCSIARELSRYQVRVMVVDKNEDVGGDASKSNSAIIHTGYDASPGTLESELVVASNPMYDRITAELDVPFLRVGAILPAVDDEQLARLPELWEKACQNKVYDVKYLSREQLLEMEPALNPEVRGGLYIPRESIIDPFLLVVGLAENAKKNGTEFLLSTRVTGIRIENGRITGAETTAGKIRCSYIVNAAGLYCDEIAAMAGKGEYTVLPRKGQFFILDKKTSVQVSHIVLPIPTKTTKGKLMCPTIDGNMLIGPTAEDLPDKEDKATTAEGLQSIETDVRRLVPGVRLSDSITQFAGLRPNRKPEGLRVDTYDDLYGYVNLSGVRSTGLTNSAAMGVYVVRTLFKMGLRAEPKTDFDPIRKGIPCVREMSDEERDALIRKDPRFGHVVCRCETVTEGEIIAAIHSPIPARSMDAVKRRLRAGMGRCQGGFCGPKIIEILSRELGIPAEEVTKKGGASQMVFGKLRDGR